MIPLMQANNADIKYPLSDFHETDVPNEALLDLSLSVPGGIEIVLGGIRFGPSTAFLTLENKADRTPIASVMVTNPIPARIYPLDMDVAGHGWVVFGPSATSGDLYYSGSVAVDLDPEVVLAINAVSPTVDVQINGFPRDVRNVLDILSGSVFLNVTVEAGVVYIDRNDDGLSTDDLVALGVEQTTAQDVSDQLFYRIGGAVPDDEGNVDIVIIGCAEGCGDARDLPVPRGDTDQGATKELPLDIYTTREYEPGDPCVEGESSSETAAYDPFDGCNNIVMYDIIDTASGTAIGTIYTVEET